MLLHGKGPGGRSAEESPQLDKNPPQFLGWRNGQNPTPVGGTFSDQHRLSAGVGTPPRPSPPMGQSIP